MTGLTHFDKDGKARMVDVSGKPVTVREAVATGLVSMQKAAILPVRGISIAGASCFFS